MSWRDPAWLQAGLDAMQATLDVDSTLKQQMIDFLLHEGFWDARKLSPAAARTRFNACMNPGKPDFFKVSELWVLMKRFQRYELWLAMGQDMGFERPRRIPTAIRRAEQVLHIDALRDYQATELAEAEDRLARIDAEQALAAPGELTSAPRLRIHAVMQDPGARFDKKVDAEISDLPEGGF